jgi:hypothetical protein
MDLNYFQRANELLAGYEPVSLAAMESVSLMDRLDMKFMLTLGMLEKVISEIKNNYYVLTIQENKVFNYRTEYFDTPEMSMFYDHHNGKLNRFKVRQRTYIDSNLSFLEVKFKSNKGRVIKDRIESRKNHSPMFANFIKRHTPYNPQLLNCMLVNHFYRFTLVDIHFRERVTTDFNLSFSNGQHKAMLNGLVILELKQNKTDKESIIYKVLKNNSLRPSSISKYCLGVSLLSGNPRINNFKPVLLKINKISHVELSA